MSRSGPQSVSEGFYHQSGPDGFPDQLWVVIRILLSIFLAFLIYGCRPDRPPPVDLSIAEMVSNSGVPGVSIAVIKDFTIQYLEVHGVRDSSTGEPVTADTLFQAASISKTLTAMCALQLVEDGKISIDEDINTSLVSWRIADNQFTEVEEVTLRRLLGHTAGTTVEGFPGYSCDDLLPSLIQILNGTSPSNTGPVVVDRIPGSSFHYSGGGYCIVQQVLIDMEQRDFPGILSERVLDRLGLMHSTFSQPLPREWEDSASSGHLSNGNPLDGKWRIHPEMAAAGLWSTPGDLALILIEMQLSLKGESCGVLDTESAEMMLTNDLVGDYGLGLSITVKLGEIYFGHSGGNQGFRCLMMAHRDAGVGAVVMTNSDSGYPLAEDIIYHIGTEEQWPGYIEW